jgi:hypothetical protein
MASAVAGNEAAKAAPTSQGKTRFVFMRNTPADRGGLARGSKSKILVGVGTSEMALFLIAAIRSFPLYITAEESFLFHFVLPGSNLEIPVGSAPTRAIADGLFWFPP